MHLASTSSCITRNGSQAAIKASYGLSSGVCSNRLDRINRFIRELHVGTVNVREVPGYRLELTPLGSIKDSGLGYKNGVGSDGGVHQHQDLFPAVVDAAPELTEERTISAPGH